jgi:hypothetical protein
LSNPKSPLPPFSKGGTYETPFAEKGGLEFDGTGLGRTAHIFPLLKRGMRGILVMFSKKPDVNQSQDI